MIDSITRITLNLQETNTMVSIRAKRGDTGRKLLIHLSDGSIPYHISDDCYATFTAKKPDGTKINNACTIENNVIEYEFTDQTCTAVGTMKAEIRLYGADRKMITSACFLINVYDTVFRDGDEVSSEGEMNTLDALILQVNELLNETGKTLRWHGNWNSEANYEANDLVLHQKVLYVAEAAVAAGVEPGSESASWMPIAGMGTGNGSSGSSTITKVSDLENDCGYITKTISDLVNYYSKSETYSKTEIEDLVSKIPKFAIAVVSELPTTGISDSTVYLVPGGDSPDLYTEYIYADGNWEILGSQKIDLSGYVTETWVKKLLEGTVDSSSDSGAQIFYTTEEPNIDSGFLFDLSQIETNEKTINIGDWIVTPSGKVYVVYYVEDWGIEASYDETLSVVTSDSGGYATKQYVTDYAQPKGDYLTEVPSGYATEEYVDKKITEAELGGEQVDLSNYALKTELPTKTSQLTNDSGFLTTAPVKSVNGETGAVNLTASKIGAEAEGTAATAVSQHNTDTDAHNDIRQELKALSDRLTAFFDSDDTTLDELSEIVAYITSNKSLIDSITTSKVNVADIVNNLTTNVSSKPLSAAQGVVLKGLIDTLSNSLSNYQPKGNYLTEIPVVSVEKGGTGATDAATARTNLGITPANIGAAASSHNHSASNINSGTLSSSRLPTVPITKGGTGATDAATARTNLGITPANIGAFATDSIITFYNVSLTVTNGVGNYSNENIKASSRCFVQRRVGSYQSGMQMVTGTTSQAGYVTVAFDTNFSSTVNINLIVINS